MGVSGSFFNSVGFEDWGKSESPLGIGGKWQSLKGGSNGRKKLNFYILLFILIDLSTTGQVKLDLDLISFA